MASGKLARFIAIFIRSFKKESLANIFLRFNFLGFLSKGETFFLFVNTRFFGNLNYCRGDINYGKYQLGNSEAIGSSQLDPGQRVD